MRQGGSRAWELALRPALRHPAAAVLVTTAGLLLLASPALGMHTRLMGFGDLPRQLPIVHTYEQIQKAFPGAQAPGGGRGAGPRRGDPAGERGRLRG